MTTPSTLERFGVCLPNTARLFFTFFDRLDFNIFKANAIELFKKYRIRIISGGDDIRESLVAKDSSIILLLALKINFKKLPKIISRYISINKSANFYILNGCGKCFSKEKIDTLILNFLDRMMSFPRINVVIYARHNNLNT